MEADEGDDYLHLPVSWINFLVFPFALVFYNIFLKTSVNSRLDCIGFTIYIYVLYMQDHGIFRDGIKEINESQPELYRRTLLQDLNRHAAVVLEGRAVGEALIKNYHKLPVSTCIC